MHGTRSPVNRANRRALQNYMRGMRKLRPKKRDYPRGGYGKAIRDWQMTLNVGKAWMRKINNINNMMFRT